MADPYSLSNDIVSRLLVDHNGTLWAATWDGLNRFDARTERFSTYKADPHSKTVYNLELVEGPDGALWLGTHSSGLHRFDPATGQFTRYQHDMTRLGTLSDNRVNSVHFDSSGTMWVGTQNGLNQRDAKTNSFTVYTQRDGLPGNAVGCILGDNNGDLWMSTNNGVVRLNSKRMAFTSYSTSDGLPGPDLTGWGACYKSPSGEMFFGGFSGAAAFRPAEVVDTSYAPRIVLTDFRLFGNSVEIGGHSPLQKSISYASHLILSHQQNVFSITFAALSYSSPPTNRYRYKMEGLDQDWNEVGRDRRQASYTTLPAGKYAFRAQGATSGGPWSEPGVALHIEILPPWWDTWWFSIACTVCLVLMVGSLYHYRLDQIAQRFHARLEERTRIAQDLHDTLLQGMLSASMQLHVADDRLPADSPAKPLVGRVLELMGNVINDGRNTLRGLRSSGADDDLYLAFSQIPQELAVPQAIDFRMIVEGQVRPLHPIIRDEVYRIGREALANAFRHSQASRVEVELEYADKLLRVLVRDDGRGIDPQVLHSGREGHWGLSGMRERAERIGARFKVWSRDAGGTEVELSVPGHVAFRPHPPGGGLRWFSG